MWSPFRRKKLANAPQAEKALPFRFAHLHQDQVAQAGPMIDQISNNQQDGLVIKGFFSPEEVAQMQNRIAENTSSIKTNTPFGQVIGKRLEAVDGDFQNLGLDDYFRYTRPWGAEMPALLGLDFEDRFENGLAPLLAQAKASVPVDSEGRRWSPATLRIIHPDKEGIQSHVGNEFNEKMPDNRHLSQMAVIHDQMSYFSLLQKPETGGELLLFEATWEDTKESLLDNHPRCVTEVEARPRHVIDLEAGDLLIFAGGRIWHKVTEVQGNVNRITLGGFLAFSKDGSKLYYWS